MNFTATRLSPVTASRSARHRSRVAYAGLAAALLASILALLIGSNAACWPAVAFALAPDLAVLYGIATGLARCSCTREPCRFTTRCTASGDHSD